MTTLLQMKNVAWIIIFTTVSSTMMAQSFDHYRWHNRLILLFSTNVEDAQLQAQLDLFAKEEEAFDDRKLKIIQITNHTIKDGELVQYSKDNYLFKKYKITPNQFTILLIGLDGSEKLRKNTALNPQALYDLIDQMPMRRQELRRKKN